MSDVTVILHDLGQGKSAAMEDLLPLVYDALRELAAARMAQESAGHTLQPTALVHEAWLRLVADKDRNWQNRAYFFTAASEAMRRILIDHARRKARLKHGGGQERLNIEGLELGAPSQDEKMLLVNDALEQLEQKDPERARIVLMKYFGGMTNAEVAQTLGIGERSVYRHWTCAKIWLLEKIREGK